MHNLTFPDLTTAQAQALLAAYDDIVNAPAAAIASPEQMVAWLMEGNATEHQAATLRAIAAGAPDWVAATELAEKTGLSPAAMGGSNARLHMKVTRRFGEAAGFPWDREERGDLVRYRMTETVAAAVLDGAAQPGA
jgi:hypothetical protein